IGIAVLSTLMLTSCASETQPAGFADGENAAQTTESPAESSDGAAPAMTADPGFVYEDISEAVTVTDTIRPELAEVITPSGTLTINEVQDVAAVAAEEIGLEPAEGSDGESNEY